MKFLLDTHTFIWFVEDDPCLPINVKTTIEDTENDKFFESNILSGLSASTNLKTTV